MSGRKEKKIKIAPGKRRKQTLKQEVREREGGRHAEGEKSR